VGDAPGGLAKNTATLNGVIPDFLDMATQTLAEVKYVGYLSYTQQIKDIYVWGVANNVKLQLWVANPRTQ
jgi:hypothetical protein